LPANWVKQNGIKKSDELDVVSNGPLLEISAKIGMKNSSVTIDVTGLNRTTIIIYIQSMYRRGYNEINVKFDDPYTYHYGKGVTFLVLEVIQSVITEFIGVEIVKQSKNLVQIKQISEDSEKDFNNLLRRILYLTVEAFKELELNLQENTKTPVIAYHHKTIAKFINYCMRLLHKGAQRDFSNSLVIYRFLGVIDEIVDIMKEIERSRLSKTVPINNVLYPLVTQTVESIDLFNKFFWSGDPAIADLLEKKRNLVASGILSMKATSETMVTGELFMQIHELLRGAIACKLKLDPTT
jgi:hypothetical protein